MVSRTYTLTVKTPADNEFGASNLTYTDTIFEDGRIVSTVRGISDGDVVNAREERTVNPEACGVDGKPDFSRIDAARIRAGWNR